jgi:hypothetical protein
MERALGLLFVVTFGLAVKAVEHAGDCLGSEAMLAFAFQGRQ